MNSDPTLELQGAMITALKANATFTALVAQRIYDRVPDTFAFPYVTLGEAQLIADKADCFDAAEIFLNVHAYSREAGFPEVKKVAAAVVGVLDDAALALTDHRLTSFLHEGSEYLIEPDGITRHAVIKFHALTEPIN